MKKIIVFICLVSISENSFSQRIEKLSRRYEDWQYGLIYLKNGNNEKHTLNYNPVLFEGIVQVKENGRLYNLTVKDIEGFEFYDSIDMKIRKFMVFPIYSEYSTFSREHFLEIIFDNRAISIVSKPTIEIKKTNEPYAHNPQFINKTILINRVLPLF